MRLIVLILLPLLGFRQVSLQSTKNPMFDFDEVIHFKYYEKIEPKWDWGTKKQLLKDQNAEDLEKLLYENSPSKLSDSSIISEHLHRSKYKKMQISESKVEYLKEAFSTRQTDTMSFSRCFPIYRDILIFKNNSKTICIAKLCLACRMSHFISSDGLDKQYFGQNGEWEILKKVLH